MEKRLRGLYVTESGDVLWDETYIFRRLYMKGQDFIRDSVRYEVIDCALVDDTVTTIVRRSF